MNLIYKGYVGMLVKAAERNDDPVPVAKQLYDQMPDEFLDKLFQMPDYMPLLDQYNARAKLFRAWFDRLYAELKKLEKESTP